MFQMVSFTLVESMRLSGVKIFALQPKSQQTQPSLNDKLYVPSSNSKNPSMDLNPDYLDSNAASLPIEL